MTQKNAMQKIKEGWKLCKDTGNGVHYLFKDVEYSRAKGEISAVKNGVIVNTKLAKYLAEKKVQVLNL